MPDQSIAICRCVHVALPSGATIRTRRRPGGWTKVKASHTTNDGPLVRQNMYVDSFIYRTQSFSILHRRHHTVMANTHISLKFIVRKTKILRQLYCHWIQYNYDPTKIIYNAFVFVCARACVLCVCWCALRKPFGGPMGGRRWPADCAPMLLCAA